MIASQTLKKIFYLQPHPKYPKQMITIDGGCDKCGLPAQVSFDVNDMKSALKGGEMPKLICTSCYEKYYSKEAIREQKLNQLLYKPWWKKILNID